MCIDVFYGGVWPETVGHPIKKQILKGRKTQTFKSTCKFQCTREKRLNFITRAQLLSKGVFRNEYQFEGKAII